MTGDGDLDAMDLDAVLGDEENSALKPQASNQARARPAYRGGTAILVFVLGVACGIPAAIFMPGFLTDHGSVVLGIVLGALLFALVVLSLIFVFRQPLWRWVFQRTEVEVTQFAGPLADVARYAAGQQVNEATQAAKSFAEIALARYAWITTRRWLVASITGLIAAMAALAGSALLFEQNKLLRVQSGLLVEQNQRIDFQNALIDTQIQLAEAERSAQIGPEVVEIGALIGAERQRYLDGGGDIENFGLGDLSSSTRGRIVAASLVARPYRYLSPSNANPRDTDGLMRTALARRPDAVANQSVLDDGPARPEAERLVDRAVSPERGDLLTMLTANGVLETEALTFLGADFSFAEFRREVAGGLSMRHARLAFADFSWTRMIECRFGAAQLDHARIENAVVRGSDFSSLAAAQVAAPFSAAGLDYLPTSMAGISFQGSVIHATGFARVNAIAPVFDGAVVAMADFTGASIGGASFRDAMIIDSVFEGASLLSMDLEGAIVFEQTFLARLKQAAAPGSFVAERWTLAPVPAGEVASHPGYVEMTNHVPESAYAGLQAWRISRVAQAQD
ncbi:pentapeptide repeat-containing protein [Hoeflea sp. YIM 152468]|uniref:pentapeptide repeat-containing protein n=1 Tax=Hoeflea sp. YIM 152468 TaxID=3031759 RepID=UPI0023DCBD4C|nr:pentapeptide repeat-containing protein [Hoeflea sp. YIM 152468]MDF1609610.1 pentapeptide repeat-containing protein [Hoeflea sp. YIM 152468]